MYHLLLLNASSNLCRSINSPNPKFSLQTPVKTLQLPRGTGSKGAVLGFRWSRGSGHRQFHGCSEIPRSDRKNCQLPGEALPVCRGRRTVRRVILDMRGSASAHAANLVVVAISQIPLPEIKTKMEEATVTPEDILY